MPTIIYKVEHLSEIVDMFREYGLREKIQADNSRTQIPRAIFNARSATWREAANIIENIIIESPPPKLREVE